MANHKNAAKAARKAIKRTLINSNRLNRIRTFLKKAENVIVKGNINDSMEAVAVAEREIMRGVQKGVIHRNTAARRVSKLVKKARLAAVS